MSAPLVSVVVPTYDSAEHLGTLLDSVRRQTHGDVEVVVVDGGSGDGTPEVARRRGARLVEERSNRSRARNLGLEAARGRYVLSVDADMELSPRVVEECVAAMREDEGVGGVVIPETSVGDSFWVRARDLERSLYAGTAVESARFFRTEQALEVGGYDEDLTFFEESTLPRRLARRGLDVTRRVEAEIRHHEEGFSLPAWLRKKYRYGRTADRYLEGYGEHAAEQVSPVARLRTLLSRPRELLRRPGAGMLVLKALEYGAAGAGALSGRLDGRDGA